MIKKTHRKRFAIVAMASVIIQMCLLDFYVSIERIEALKSVLEAFNYSMISIILGYLGIATYSKQKENSSEEKK